MAWHTLTSIRARWSEAPKTDAVLQELLDVAKIQVVGAAPELADETDPPANYREAQHLQVRALYASYKGNPGTEDGTIGLEGYSVRRSHYQMGSDVMKLLYPKRDWIG